MNPTPETPLVAARLASVLAGVNPFTLRLLILTGRVRFTAGRCRLAVHLGDLLGSGRLERRLAAGRSNFLGEGAGRGF